MLEETVVSHTELLFRFLFQEKVFIFGSTFVEQNQKAELIDKKKYESGALLL